MKNFLSSTLKFSGIAALMVVLLFSSCGKDEGGGSKVSEAKLNGKWALRKEVYKEYENGKLVDSEIDDYSGDDNYFEFKDGEMININPYSGERIAIPYTISSDSKKIILTCSGEDCPSESGIMEVKKLDSKNLILYLEDSYKEDGITYKESIEYHFVKI